MRGIPVRRHLADAILRLHDADVMPTATLIGGECRDEAMLVLADVPATPLVDTGVLWVVIEHRF